MAIYKSAPGTFNRGAMEEYHVFGHTLATWRKIAGIAGVLMSRDDRYGGLRHKLSPGQYHSHQDWHLTVADR